MERKHLDILNSLDIDLDDLTEHQQQILTNVAKKIKNPNRMTANEAVKIVKELGIDIEALQKKMRQQPRVRTKIGRNQPCPCDSGKKYKKCCGTVNQ